MKFIGGGAQHSIMMMLELTSYKILIDTLKQLFGNHWLSLMQNKNA